MHWHGIRSTGQFQWSGHYLINPWEADGLAKLNGFPRLRAYLETHRNPISKRNTAQRNPLGWYRTIDRVNVDLTAKPKLYIHDIKDCFNPVLDQGETYPHHNLYYILSDRWDLEVLGGLLLSSVGQLFIEAYGVRMRGGYLRFQAQYLRRIRVPKPEDLSAKQSAQLVKAFRERDRRLASAVALEDLSGERLGDAKCPLTSTPGFVTPSSTSGRDGSNNGRSRLRPERSMRAIAAT